MCLWVNRRELGRVLSWMLGAGAATALTEAAVATLHAPWEGLSYAREYQMRSFMNGTAALGLCAIALTSGVAFAKADNAGVAELMKVSVGDCATSRKRAWPVQYC